MNRVIEEDGIPVMRDEAGNAVYEVVDTRTGKKYSVTLDEFPELSERLARETIQKDNPNNKTKAIRVKIEFLKPIINWFKKSTKKRKEEAEEALRKHDIVAAQMYNTTKADDEGKFLGMGAFDNKVLSPADQMTVFNNYDLARRKLNRRVVRLQRTDKVVTFISDSWRKLKEALGKIHITIPDEVKATIKEKLKDHLEKYDYYGVKPIVDFSRGIINAVKNNGGPNKVPGETIEGPEKQKGNSLDAVARGIEENQKKNPAPTGEPQKKELPVTQQGVNKEGTEPKPEQKVTPEANPSGGTTRTSTDPVTAVNGLGIEVIKAINALKEAIQGDIIKQVGVNEELKNKNGELEDQHRNDGVVIDRITQENNVLREQHEKDETEKASLKNGLEQSRAKEIEYKRIIDEMSANLRSLQNQMNEIQNKQSTMTNLSQQMDAMASMLTNMSASLKGPVKVEPTAQAPAMDGAGGTQYKLPSTPATGLPAAPSGNVA